MLTAKSIGGGGAAEVTNGVLQEMYAAEGEIPANTFVDVRERLGEPESDESFECLGMSELDSVSYDMRHLNVNNIDLLLYITSSSYDRKLTVNIKYKKMEGHSYISMPNISVSGAPAATYDGRFNTKMDYLDLIVLDQNRILFIGCCDFYKNSSLTTSANLTYFIAELSDDGVLSIPEGSALKFLEIFTLNSPNYLQFNSVRSYKIDESTIGCFVPYSITNRNSSGTYTSMNSKVDAMKLSLDSNGILSIMKRIDRQSTITSAYDTHKYFARVLNIVSAQNYLLVGFSLLAKNNTKCAISVLVIDKDSWSATTLKEGAVELIFNSDVDWLPRFFYVDDCFIVFNNTTKKTLTVSVFRLELNSNAQIATLLNSLPNVQDSDLIETDLIYTDSEILNNHRFMINASSANSSVKGILKVLQLKDGRLLEITDWFKAPDIIPDNSYHFVVLQAVNDLIVLLGDNQAYICKFGSFYPFVHLPTDTFKGLTKTACTETKKGQVWLLNTQEGEE